MASNTTTEEEFHFLKDTSCSDSAKIHGVIASMKKGKSARFFMPNCVMVTQKCD